MPDVVTLGPLILSFDRLVALGLIVAYLGIAGRLLAGPNPRHARLPWLSVMMGLAGARIGFVVLNWPAYRTDPWSALYLWQGGFSASAGIVAALATLAVGLRGVRRFWRPALLLGALGFAWFGYVQLDRASPRAAFPTRASVTSLDGQPIDLAGLKGRPFVVNLWATWCPPCRREMPMLVAAAAEHEQVPVFLVNQGEHPDLVRRFLRAENLAEDHVLADRGAVLLRLTGGGGLPTTLFVRADSAIEEVHVGELSRAALAMGIRRIHLSSQR